MAKIPRISQNGCKTRTGGIAGRFMATRSSRARHGAPQGSTGDRLGSPCATNDFPLPTHIRNPEPGTKYTGYVRSGRSRSHHDRGPSPDILPRNRAQAPGPASPPESWSPSGCDTIPTISPRSLVNITPSTPWNPILHIGCSSKMPLRGDNVHVNAVMLPDEPCE